MNEMFSQGGKGSTGILTNKQAIARKFGVKQNEVVYFSVGVDLGGYKVIYDKATQRAYSLPVLSVGTTAVSLDTNAVFVHSAGSVDLGELAVNREEYITLPGSFATGATLIAKNELLTHTNGKYRWDGELPKIVSAGSTPETAGGIGLGAWVSVGDASIRTELSGENGDELIGVKQPFTDSAKRTQHDKNKEIVSVLDFYLGIDPDYTNAFNRALAASNEVFVPDGDFTVSGSININSFQTLRGTGYGSQIKTSSGMTDPVISIHGSGYPTGAVSYATVTDLVISNDYGKTMDGLEIINASYINVQRVFVNNCKNGAYLDSVELIDFNNCYFSGGGEFGIRAISSRSGLVNSWISVTDCMVNGNVLGGCRFVDSASTVLTNVKVINNQDYGVYLQLTIPSQRMWVTATSIVTGTRGFTWKASLAGCWTVRYMGRG